MSIEGIPDGWEQEKVGQISFGEYWVNNFGQPQRWDSDHPSSSKNYVIIRKKQKQYRPLQMLRSSSRLGIAGYSEAVNMTRMTRFQQVVFE